MTFRIITLRKICLINITLMFSWFIYYDDFSLLSSDIYYLEISTDSKPDLNLHLTLYL